MTQQMAVPRRRKYHFGRGASEFESNARMVWINCRILTLIGALHSVPFSQRASHLVDENRIWVQLSRRQNVQPDPVAPRSQYHSVHVHTRRNMYLEIHLLIAAQVHTRGRH